MFSPVLGIVLGGSSLLIGLLGAVATAAAAAFLRKKDTGIEERRDSAIDAATKLQSLGLIEFANLVKLYAIGDYDKLLAGVITLIKSIRQEGGLLSMLSQSFFKQLPERLNDPVERAKIMHMVEGWKTSHPEETATAK